MPLPYCFFALSSISHLSFLLFFFRVSSSVMSPLFYCFPFSTSVAYHFSSLWLMLKHAYLLCPSSFSFLSLWSFLFSFRAASSPSFFLFIPLRQIYRVMLYLTKAEEQWANPSLMWNIGSSLFNYTYQDQLYSWITWFHKTCSLFPTVPSQFSLWKLCFARCPVTHLLLVRKVACGFDKNKYKRSNIP